MPRLCTTLPQLKKQQEITASGFIFVSNDLNHKEGKLSGRLQRTQGHCVLLGGAIIEEESPVITELFKDHNERWGRNLRGF